MKGGVDREHLTDLGDALNCVGALAPWVDPTELFVVQTASKPESKIQALNKEYWEYEKDIKRIKVLENCIIEVEFEPIEGFDLIEYKQKFKRTPPEEIILEL